MRDQAEELRSLVLKSIGLQSSRDVQTPCIVAAIGGKGGVGTTTFSVNLSVALAQLGHRVVVVDAHLGRSDVAALCRLRERYGIFDVLAARRDIHEVLEAGPVGIHVLPGTWGPEAFTEISKFSRQRFMQRLKTLGPHTDWIIVDAGNQVGPFMTSLFQVVQRAFLITSPDTVSVMDTYATIKMLVQQADVPPICTVVNQTTNVELGREIHQRIANSCQRFLQFHIGAAGEIPLDPNIVTAAEIGVPFITKSPTCPAARSFERIATRMTAEFASQRDRPSTDQAAA